MQDEPSLFLQKETWRLSFTVEWSSFGKLKHCAFFDIYDIVRLFARGNKERKRFNIETR